MEPKHKIGDIIWFMRDNVICHGAVTGIQKSNWGSRNEDGWEYSIELARSTPNFIGIGYMSIKHKYTDETLCFDSKDALINSL